jgi:hypothetical protein
VNQEATIRRGTAVELRNVGRPSSDHPDRESTPNARCSRFVRDRDPVRLAGDAHTASGTEIPSIVRAMLTRLPGPRPRPSCGRCSRGFRDRGPVHRAGGAHAASGTEIPSIARAMNPFDSAPEGGEPAGLVASGPVPQTPGSMRGLRAAVLRHSPRGTSSLCCRRAPRRGRTVDGRARVDRLPPERLTSNRSSARTALGAG